MGMATKGPTLVYGVGWLMWAFFGPLKMKSIMLSMGFL